MYVGICLPIGCRSENLSANAETLVHVRVADVNIQLKQRIFLQTEYCLKMFH